MKKRLWAFVCVLAAAGLVTGCLSSGSSRDRDVIKYINQGDKAYYHEDWDTAIAEYSKGIRIEPSAGMYNARGLAYLAKGDAARAEKDFNEALRIDPSNRYTKEGLSHVRAPRAAYLLWKEGKDARRPNANSIVNYDLAIEKYSQAIALFPDYLAAYSDRGDAYFYKRQWQKAEAGLYDKAEADYKKTVELDPEYYEGYAKLGNICIKRGEYDTAEQYLNRVLKIIPEHFSAKSGLAEIIPAARAEVVRKAAYNRRFAAATSTYPSPFEGTWANAAFTTPDTTELRSRLVHRDVPVYDYSKHQYEGIRKESVSEPYIEKVPGQPVPAGTHTLTFNGKYFVKTQKDSKSPSATVRGTFYYDGNRIELEDGTVLRFTNGRIEGGRASYIDHKVTEFQEFTYTKQ